MLRNSVLTVLFVLVAATGRSQRFYYVEPGGHFEKTIQTMLRSEKQYLTESPLASDYTIRTSIDLTSPGSFSVRLSMIDSLSFQKIMEVEEHYTIALHHRDVAATIPLAFEILLERYFRQMIRIGNLYHVQQQMNGYRSGKDNI